MRELLKEARDILGDAYYDGVEPLSDGTRAMIAKVIKRIDAALSAPAPDAARVVPRAMLDEIWLNGYQCKDGKKDTDMAEIADKHGYKVEG